MSPRSCRGQQAEDTWPLPLLECPFLLCSPESWACVHPALGLWEGTHVAAPLASQTGGTFLFITHGSSQRRQWHPTPVLLPGKSHGRRGLVGCSSWGREKLDTTEQLPFHFSLSCIGEGNGNPLQCSFLENPRNGEAWWASVYVYGVAQSRT